MSASKTDAAIPDLTDKSNFRHWVQVSIRFSDQDNLGHVNNVAISQYVEQGRVNLIDGLMRDRGKDIDHLLANVCIDFRREIHFPGTVEVGGRLIRIGTKSVTTGYGLFKDGVNVATATSVNVFFDPKTGKPMAMTERVRKFLEEELAKG